METKTYPETNKKFKRRGLVFFLRTPYYLHYYYYYLYILRKFKKLVIVFFSVKNTPKLINQQLKNEVKIVN